MKVVKRILIIAGVLLLLLVVAAFSVPFLFKDKLLAFAKEQINASVMAKVDFQDVNLSLFRSFPNLSFQLQNFSVTGIDAFEGVRLAGGQSAEFTLDLLSVLSGNGPVEIKSVHLEKPEINIHVLTDGTANYDIVKPSETPEPAAEETDYSDLKVNLHEYSVNGANIVYDDKSADIFLEIKNLNHSGEGNFTINVFDLKTQTALEAMTVTQGGVSFLNNAKANLDATLQIDQQNSKYTFKDNTLRINELQLNAAGYVQMPENGDIAVDMKVSTPQNDFKSLFSLIPSAYIAGYENVKVNGKFNLNAEAKGVYNGEKEQYPAFKLQMAVENGDVKYPDLPLGIANIQANIDVNSPTSNFDNMVVNVSRFAMKVGSNPFEAKFLLKTPISDPDVDATARGVINLGELAQAFPMQGIQQLKGIISADIAAKARMSFIENQEYERVNMKGQLGLKDLVYHATDLPAVNIRDAQMDFTPQNVQLHHFDAKLGKSDIQASGTIDNILAYFSPKKTMRGNLKVRSGYFDANEWLTEEAPATAGAVPQQPVTSASGETAAGERPFDRFDFTMDAEAKEIVYADYHIRNAALKGNAKPNRLQVQNIAAQIGKSDFQASGVITDAFDYLFDNGTLGGNIKFRSGLLDLNQFMTTDPAAAAATTGSTTAPATTAGLEPIRVPANIAMTINADVDKIIYTNMVLEDLKGTLVVENESVVLQNATTRTLGGSMAVEGGYDSKNVENPAFNFKFDLKRMDFQRSFNTFNTFQVIAPIGKYIEGLFNTSLIMEGRLGKDMMPDLASLNAQGFLQTIDGFIKSFKPLQAIGNSLNINELKSNLKLTDSKNWFELKNGAVEVKEFDYKVNKDIAMKISGTHGLNQSMDYKLKTKIPRKLLEKNAIGAAASSGYNALAKEASKYGLNLKQSEFVNVMINLTGSITDPKVKLQLLGGDGESTLAETAEGAAKEELEKQKEELRKKAEAKLEEGKAVAKEKIEQVADTARKVINKKVDELKDKATQTVKDKVGEKAGTVLDSTARKKVDDVLQGAGKESKDKIKDELDKFNPFKKKKKEEEKKDGGG